jgi:hypothetical protein
VRFHVTAEARPDEIEFVPGKGSKEVLIWSVAVFDSEGPNGRAHPRRELLIVTGRRGREVELSRVRDVLLVAGIQTESTTIDGPGFVLAGSQASDVLSPPWADAVADSLDAAPGSWLSDYDGDALDGGGGLAVRHCKTLLQSGRDLGETRVEVVQYGWVSGGILIYDPPEVQATVTCDSMPAELVEQLAAALTEAASLVRQVAS